MLNILEYRVQGLTTQTITEPVEFLEALEQVRQTGYALDRGEAEEGACCVAVRVPVQGLPIHAAISLSAPATRFPEAPLDLVVAAPARAATEIASEAERT